MRFRKKSLEEFLSDKDFFEENKNSWGLFLNSLESKVSEKELSAEEFLNAVKEVLDWFCSRWKCSVENLSLEVQNRNRWVLHLKTSLFEKKFRIEKGRIYPLLGEWVEKGD